MQNSTPNISTDIKRYSLKQFASFLSISKNRVYDLIYANRIPAMDLGGLKVRHEALADFLKNTEGYEVDFNHPENLYVLQKRTAQERSKK